MSVFDAMEIDKLRAEVARLRLAIVWLAESYPMQKYIGGPEALEVMEATEAERTAVHEAKKESE